MVGQDMDRKRCRAKALTQYIQPSFSLHDLFRCLLHLPGIAEVKIEPNGLLVIGTNTVGVQSLDGGLGSLQITRPHVNLGSMAHELLNHGEANSSAASEMCQRTQPTDSKGKTYLPPVTRMTLPPKAGISVSGLNLWEEYDAPMSRWLVARGHH